LESGTEIGRSACAVVETAINEKESTAYRERRE